MRAASVDESLMRQWDLWGTALMAMAEHYDQSAVLPGDPGVRAKIVLATTEYCTSANLSPAARERADGLLLQFAQAVETQVRIAMAYKLADCEWAPPGIVRYLAFDQLTVARPILLKAQQLRDEDLIALSNLSAEHRKLIAARKALSPPVCETLTYHNEDDVLDALARNIGARLSANAFEDLLDAARRNETLLSHLAARFDLPQSFAKRLIRFASDAIKDEIIKRYPRLPEHPLHEVGEAAVQIVQHEAPTSISQALVKKLHQSGRLTPSYVLRALSERRLEVFDYAVAELADIEVEQWRRALSASGPRAAALALRAMEVDRSAYASLCANLEAAGRMITPHRDALSGLLRAIYADYSPDDARKALRSFALPASIR